MSELKEIESYLGRYELKDETHNKFYEVVYDTANGWFCVFWGRIGSRPQSQDGVTSIEMIKKVREKLSKGYRRVGDAVDCHRVANSMTTRLVDNHKREVESARLSNENFDFEEELMKL